MAVTKIHRTSRLVLYIITGITLIVLGLFFFGGSVPSGEQLPALQGLSEPAFTDILMYWMYVLLMITIVMLLIFAIVGFFSSLKTKPKKALNSLFVLVVFAALLIITYVVGSGAPLNIVGYTGPDNVPARLKMTDMWLFSIYIMMALTTLALLLSPFMKSISKK